ncbi:hypothetical protein Scep_007169 [Stephania cephalantha]|uniref:Cation efflux protein transmembrane domain-containing protein n=1 Tax=Stephania cephalantha TaxID=152367 RepID=A0AAP0KBX4_9MAGN
MNSSIISFYLHMLYRITKRAGEKEGSRLMKANAWHHRADVVSSVVALIGVVWPRLSLFKTLTF